MTLDPLPITRLLTTSIYASIEAGKAILEVYDTDFAVERKTDDSPLTLADKRAHSIIVSHLKPIGFPILSEEGRHLPFDERKDWGLLWIVDPLDGTKEFVKRNGEFTVNIALVKNGRPVLGVVFVPVNDRLYFADEEIGAFRLENVSDNIDLKMLLQSNDPSTDLEEIISKSGKLPLQPSPNPVFTIVGSRSHPSPELEAFVEKFKKEHEQVEFISAGSSLKICLVAEGTADIYPRLGPTMEWDTAAGQAIAENAGADLLHFETQKPLLYNKKDLLNPWFIVKKERFK